ncbi:peptidoglycan/LPS O-acetylase OafA/YrhL [Bradyrhizobium sp. F1.13.3]
MPMFFALSGFLVAGSLLRSKTLIAFMGLRAIRIFPALGAEVVLSALILGPLLTVLPIKEYFSDPLFARYLFNLIGHVQFVLPGVFSNNPIPNVINSQLWTIPFELLCYISLGVLAIIGAKKRRWIILASALVLEITIFIRDQPGSWLWKNTPDGHVSGKQLVVAFLLGVALYLYRDQVRLRGWLFLLCGASSLILLCWPFGDYVAAFPIAYVTIYIGLLNPAKLKILAGADFSYGVYLYGFPIQQTYARLGILNVGTNLVLSLVTTAAVAALSWNLIEKPAQGLREPLKRLERLWLSLIRQTTDKGHAEDAAGTASLPLQPPSEDYVRPIAEI